ncbi:hypothetical protein NLJ89_g11494 [Agrocybe chaxingu]|uniref:Uncharacterized protein n=1 Tax=Agrocybe chaxingu TaxID=84603 RepID=A0A9W8JS93_9AGAR|nr:hypothetical protein NLJ89_g11494 [Agrocybe chaxingu]
MAANIPSTLTTSYSQDGGTNTQQHIPSKYTIGDGRTTKPLVTLLEIKGHLAILHLFAVMRLRIESLEVSVPHMPLDSERRWGWFVGLAVERFDIWCRSLHIDDSRLQPEIVLPPLDVLMVWHSYMLNPRWYAEDCLRIPACGVLQTFEPLFEQILKGQIIIPNTPSIEQVDFWVTKTSQPFDYIDSVQLFNQRTIACPHCTMPIAVYLMTDNGTGYLQQNFTANCIQGCGLLGITKERLAFRKFVQDLAATPPAYLPGTFFNPASPAARNASKAMKRQVSANIEANIELYGSFRDYPQGSPEYINAYILAAISYASFSMSKLIKTINPSSTLINKILSAYNNDKIYSIDLIGAVLRQGSFVQKMYDLQWTRPGFFDEPQDEMALHHATARYHAFLDLMASSPASFFVPTLDIDLVWHTHQLMPSKYQADCNTYVKQFIDQ